MNKSLILNFKILKEEQLNLQDLLYLYKIYSEKDFYINNDDVDFEGLQKNLFIKIIEKEVYLREKAKKLIEFLSIEVIGSFNIEKKKKTKSKRVILSLVDDRIEEFRNKWKGLKPGSMGSVKACRDKLHRWMKENPEYTFDDILKAVDLYLATEGANIRYLQRADYFIFKQDIHKDEMSRLSAFIDEIDDDNNSSDWTSNLN